MYSKNNWNSRLAGDGVAVSYKGKHNRTIYSSIPLLGFYLQEMKIFVHKKTFTWTFTKALITINQNLKCPTGEKMVLYPCNGSLLSNKQTAVEATWLNLKGITQTETSQAQKTAHSTSPVILKSRKGRTIVTESRSVVAWSQDMKMALTAERHKGTFWDDENVLYYDCVCLWN